MLLVSASIHLEPPPGEAVQVRREMIVFGSDGVVLSRVAAVVVDHATPATTHVPLGRRASGLEYRLVPLRLIGQVDEAAVWLRISSRDVSQLPWRTAPVDPKAWAPIGLAAAAASLASVLLAQAVATALWPEVALFRPLDSYARSAAFVLLAAVVLAASFIPDYGLPDPNKTLLASTDADGLHVVAGIATTGMLVAGCQRLAHQR